MDTIGKKLALKEKMAYGSPPQQLALSAEGIIFPLLFISWYYSAFISPSY